MITNTGTARLLDRITRITPNIRCSPAEQAQRHASADPPILRVIVYRISTACSIYSFAMVA